MRPAIRTAAARAGAAMAPLRNWLTLRCRALAARAGAALRPYLDGGYHPDDGASPREPSGITIDNLSVAYGRRLAVDRVSGEFVPGSLTAVVGPNGAGKTSLLKALAGVVPARGGGIVCPALAGNRLAYLPQQSELDRDFPVAVAELVALGAWRGFGAFRAPPSRLDAAIGEALAAVGLEDLVGRPIGELSAGQFQRALFARLILQDASVILLDEPLAAVDDSTSADLLRIIERWRDERRTVVAVLHDLDQVRAHFPQTLMLARSCVAWGDTATELTAENLARARDALKAPATGRARVAA
jgi:zinc/manganese transport system ATP-binding protein